MYKHSLKYESGFTLIELMLVIAIIGVIIAFALPAYQNYVIKAQVNRVFYELTATRTAIESIMAHGALPSTKADWDGKTVGNKKWEYIGLNPKNHSSLMFKASVNTDHESADRFNTLSATLGGNAHHSLVGSEFQLIRGNSGEWRCEIKALHPEHWQSSWTPSSCTLQ